VYADGNNEISILRTSDGKIERSFRPDNVGAIYNVTWSPNGREVVFSGSKGGVSDLYLMDVATGTTRQLTNDLYAQIQPTFSPDGKTIAFATDQGEPTNFEQLTFGPLRLATMDVASGQVTLRQAFPQGRHINPQFTPDGQSLYFVSDQDGIADIYRMELASGAIVRLTHLKTGVSGITSISSAISVARSTGRLMFTTFKDQGHEILALEPSQLAGVAVNPASAAQHASAATLPPGDVAGNMTVATYLADPTSGLVSGSDFKVVPYHASFALDALGQPQIGVQTGGYFGTGIVGGISALFGDQLGDQQIYSVLQANGTVKDFGGALFYQNLKRRINWGAGAQHVPILSGGTFYAQNGQFINYYQVIQRIFVDQAQISGQYPFSSTRRAELSLSGTRLGYEQQIDSIVLTNSFIPLARGTRFQSGIPAQYYAQANAALVGDNSFAAYTSPVSGMRYRLEAGPTVGSVKFNTALADFRRYFFALRPLTFAFRGMHYGRYGGDADNLDKVSPIFLGEETLIRGYGYSTLVAECNNTANFDPNTGRCPVFDRLLGSRIAVFNAEMRIPVFGSPAFGLVNFPYLPLEVSPFFDAGMAWTSDQSPDVRFVSGGDNTVTGLSCSNNTQISLQGFAAPCARRIPVFSTGVSFRMNVLGYMILETYVAHPFQRNYRDWVVGIQAAPGW